MAPVGNKSILPLESFSLPAVPRSTHNIAWSPDAELAVGCDDCVFIYIPEFIAPEADTKTGENSGMFRQYNDAALRFPSVEHRHPDLNRPLFEAVNQDFPDFEHVPGGGGSGTITSQGSSMNHLVALEWSPSGLGRMKRSALAVLSGAGAITVYCEGASDGMNAFQLRGRNARTLRPWVAPWGIGAGLLLPRFKGHEAEYSKEYITSFAWARDTNAAGQLLAYANDDGEIVIVSVLSKHDSNVMPGDCGQWRVEEVGRFEARGPHPELNENDPDYSPSGSSFSLSWSPWLKIGSRKTSILSYVADNFVGFRQVTAKWTRKGTTTTPDVKVDEVDCNGVCLYLSTDAFVVWEDLIWTIGPDKVCRGIIATPFKVQSFQVPFNSIQPKIVSHTTDECNSTYPAEEEGSQAQNPITGLIIHPPCLSHQTPAPYYSLVRLSATHENDAWYQTNLPLPPNPEDGTSGPKWATEINQIVEHQLPRQWAHRLATDLAKLGSEDSDDDDFDDMEMDGDIDDLEDEGEGEGEGEVDGEGEGEIEEVDPTTDVMAGLDTEDQVYMNRIRIWGITASPGGGVTAVFASQYGTIWPGRDTFAGSKCRVLFGKHDREEADPTLAVKKLSTEARAWEWMYGEAPPVLGVSPGIFKSTKESEKRAALKDHFKMIRRSQTCTFCNEPLKLAGKSSRCRKGHHFSTCATTGLSILAPGISRACSVCGSKCLKPEDLIVIAPQLKDIITSEISAELCGGCGGKFIN